MEHLTPIPPFPHRKHGQVIEELLAGLLPETKEEVLRIEHRLNEINVKFMQAESRAELCVQALMRLVNEDENCTIKEIQEFEVWMLIRRYIGTRFCIGADPSD